MAFKKVSFKKAKRMINECICKTKLQKDKQEIVKENKKNTKKLSIHKLKAIK